MVHTQHQQQSVSVTHFKHNKIVTQMLALGNGPETFFYSLFHPRRDYDRLISLTCCVLLTRRALLALIVLVWC